MLEPVSHLPSARHQRVLLLGATGTIGAAVHRALRDAGHSVVCLGRSPPPSDASLTGVPGASTWHQVSLTDAHAVRRAVGALGPIDAVLSCLASRTGVPEDAWAVDFHAQRHVLEAAMRAGIPRFLLLSAICVQKPRLAFQHAKLAFEAALADSGLDHAVVRPTAFFKSLSGQITRVQAGKPFLMFGDGTLTACKPISDRDLASYMVALLEAPRLGGRILPIGGPGPAFTPRAQGELLFRLLARPARFRQVSPALLKGLGHGLQAAARVLPRLARTAELARIGHYYATESMLVWDPLRACYDEHATPSTGADTLEDHFRAILAGQAHPDRGAHAVF